MKYPNTWFSRFSKNTKSFYVYGNLRINDQKKQPQLHRWIMDAPNDLVVDHINHKTLDNRRSNLRLLTNAENMQNRKIQRNNTSGVPGVTWHKQYNKWQASIHINNRFKFLGRYVSIEEAAEAVRLAKSKLMPYSQEATIR